MKRNLVITAVLVCLPAALMADFSYKETTQITGGALARMMKMAAVFSKQAGQPIESTLMLKGNRLARVGDKAINIIDLDKETITEINTDKKTYSVMTFAEMAQAMKAMQEKYSSKQKSREAPDAEVSFKAEVKETGRSENIGGIPAKEVILTMIADVKDKKSGDQGEMKIISDMWLANKIAGYDQVKSFYMRMGEKLAFTPGGMAMMPGGAEAAKGMSSLAKEVAKMDGVPVRQVVKMTGEGMPGATGNSPPPPSLGEAVGGALSGRLGGFGGFGRKKKKVEEKTEEPKAQESTEGSLIETTTEMANFSSAPVDASKFEVPAGFEQVESPLVKMTQK